MSKKIIIIIIVVLAVVAIWYFFFPRTVVSPASSAIGAGQEATAKAQDSLNSVGKVNPFNVDVSPYSGYKNPFTK